MCSRERIFSAMSCTRRILARRNVNQPQRHGGTERNVVTTENTEGTEKNVVTTENAEGREKK